MSPAPAAGRALAAIPVSAAGCQSPCRDCGGQVKPAGEPQGCSRTPVLQQAERAGRCSQYGPQFVRTVEQAQAPTATVVTASCRPHGRGKRAAHQDRRQAQDDGRKCQACDAGPRDPQRRLTAQGNIDPPRQIAEPRADRSTDGNQQEVRSVEPERAKMAVRPRAEQPVPQPQSSMKTQHGRRGRGWKAENQPQLTEPCHLVDQGRNARTEEHGRHGRQAGSRRRTAANPFPSTPPLRHASTDADAVSKTPDINAAAPMSIWF